MSGTDKQRRIHRLYTLFSELCTEIASQKFEIWEDTPKDPPDISVGDGELGIEFVDFVSGWRERGGSSVKASEVIFDRIVKKAQQRFESVNATRLWVTFFWLKHTYPKKSAIPNLAQAIVNVLSSLSLREGDSLEIEWNNFAETDLANYLDSILVTAMPNTSTGIWNSSQAGWVGFEKEAFEEVTREKEKDLCRYSSKFKSCWLVIVAEGSAMSSISIPLESVKPGCIVSKFDRVYLFNNLTRQITLLTDSGT